MLAQLFGFGLWRVDQTLKDHEPQAKNRHPHHFHKRRPEIFVMTGDMPGSLAPVLHDPPGLADITG